MEIKKGNNYNFLGMNVNILEDKKFQIDMIEHVKDIKSFVEEELGEIILEERLSSASNFNFKVDESTE